MSAQSSVAEASLNSAEDEALEENDNLQFVTFISGGEVFAVDMAPVQEIIRVPESVKVPLAPSCLDGLSNLRGKVLPIISLRHIFNFEAQQYNDATRAVVIDYGQPLGFVVDKVASVIDVEPQKIEEVSNFSGSIDSELLSGILKDVGGYSMVMVLNFEKLIEEHFSEIETIRKNPALRSLVESELSQVAEDEDSDERHLVSFSVAEQEYAIDICDVQEIVQIPETIIRVPNSEAHVLGIMTLRERLLPLISLRSLFSLSTRELDERCRVVVVALGHAAVGIVTDSVSEVLRVPLAEVEEIPAFLASDEEFSDITQICRLNGGKRLVSVISAENMFRNSAVKKAIETVEDMDENALSEDDVDDDINEDEEQVVVFHLGDGEFGVAIESVQEIVRIPEELTHVPKSPSFVEGVINLRGTVLPVIDQRKRLGLGAIDRNDRQRIMVFILEGVRTGFIVDAVTEVLKIQKNQIESSPKLSEDQSNLLGRVANLEGQKRMVQLLNTEFLLNDGDAKSLKQLAE